MKTHAAISIIVLLTLSLKVNATHVSGWWKNSTSRQLMEVIDVAGGIKIRAEGTDRWFYYDARMQGRFEDYRGNQFQLHDDDYLEWISYNGDQRKFYYRPGSNRADREQYPERSDRHLFHESWFEGHWKEKTLRSSIFIDIRPQGLRLDNGRQRSIYRRIGDSTWRNNHGTILRLINREKFELIDRNERILVFRRERL